MPLSINKVAVASRSFSKNSILRSELLEKYPCAKFNDTGRTLCGQELVDFLLNSEKAIIGLEKIDKFLLKQVPSLRVISKYGVGLDSINLFDLNEYKVSLGYKPGVNKQSVAELTLMHIIALLHRVPESYKLVRDGVWAQVNGVDLRNKSVGIIGFGNVGMRLFELLKPFDCNILISDIRDFSHECKVHNIQQVDLLDLVRLSDVITLHIPYNKENHHIINREIISNFKLNSIFLNYARGGLVDELALLDALKDSRISGAALDVFECEPDINSNLLNMSNVLITSHIGGSTLESVLAMGRAAIMGLDNNHSASTYF